MSRPSSPMNDVDMSLLDEESPPSAPVVTLPQGEFLAMCQNVTKLMGWMEEMKETTPKKKRVASPSGAGDIPSKRGKLAPSSPSPSCSTAADEPGFSTQMVDIFGKEEDEEEAGIEDGEVEEENDGEDIYDRFTEALAAPKETGPPVSDTMASLLKTYGRKIEDGPLKTLLDKYKRPENCPKLGVPATNQEVRGTLNPTARHQDVRLMNIQLTIAHAATALVHCTEALKQVSLALKPKSKSGTASSKGIAEVRECAQHLADAMAFTGHATHALSLTRREIHRPCLPYDTRGMCGPQVPMTDEWLYPPGADFNQTLREVKATSALSDRKKRYGGQSRFPASSSSSHPFLGRGHHHHHHHSQRGRGKNPNFHHHHQRQHYGKHQGQKKY